MTRALTDLANDLRELIHAFADNDKMSLRQEAFAEQARETLRQAAERINDQELLNDLPDNDQELHDALMALVPQGAGLDIGVSALVWAAARRIELLAKFRAAILDIDAHATPLGEDDDGFVAIGYAVSVGSLHRALGLVGHSAAKCVDLPCPRAADVLDLLATHLPPPACDTCGGSGEVRCECMDWPTGDGSAQYDCLKCDLGIKPCPSPRCDNGRLALDVWLARVAERLADLDTTVATLTELEIENDRLRQLRRQT